jgi:2-iminoacetate synthase
MSFLSVLESYPPPLVEDLLRQARTRSAGAVLGKESPGEMDFLTLLADCDDSTLESMAQCARRITRQRFGNAVVLFTPLYVSNVCDNLCPYCSFGRQFTIERRHLTFEQIREEARAIGETGMRHILMLTGESRAVASPDYLAGAADILAAQFSSVGIEVYPLTEQEYGRMIDLGVDALTIYQEVYGRDTYRRLHAGGPKDRYEFRLEAPERACSRGMHAVTVGPLLGLGDWRIEGFYTYLHVKYLLRAYPGCEIAVALPRVRPLVSDFTVPFPVSDRQFVRLVTALRIAFPSAGITVSTRESKEFRNAIVPLGVTKMSAGVSTAVGGRAGTPSTSQFEIADTRTLDEMRADLLALGFQPVMHDWNVRIPAGERAGCAPRSLNSAAV